VSQYEFKFLARGAIGPVSEYAWPKPIDGRPGRWVEADGALELCANGVHVCRADELAHWLHEELWVVEIDGEPIEGIDCVLAARGRLVRPIEAWANGGAARFARAARDHAAQLVAANPGADQVRLQKLLADAAAHFPHGATALSAFCSAMTIAWLHGGDHFDDEGYRRERVWQSRFIADDLALSTITAPGS
jgi:hypothetical protein